MSLANILVPNNLPVKGGSTSVISIAADTTGYPLVALPGTQVGAIVTLDTLALEAGDYLIEYQAGVNTVGTTPAQDLGVEIILNVVRAAPPLNAAIDINNKFILNQALVGGFKTNRFTCSGTVLVRLLAAATINLTAIPSSANDVEDSEIFCAPIYGITAKKVNATGTFQSL